MGSSVILPTPGQPATGADPNFKSQSQSPRIIYSTDKVGPPANVYVNLEDQLLIDIRMPTLTPPVTVRSMGRLLLPEGRIIPYQFDDIVNGTSFTIIRQLAEGFLLSHSAVCLSAAAVFPGAIYYRAALVRGSLPFPNIQLMIMESYVDNFFTPTYPFTAFGKPQDGAGRVRSVVNAAPAAGADFVITVPANARWKFMSLRAVLTTSAAAGNRQVRISMADGSGNVFWANASKTVQTAGQALAYDLGTGVTSDVVNLLENTIGAPSGVMLSQSFTINSITSGILAGDQWSTQIVLSEEFAEL